MKGKIMCTKDVHSFSGPFFSFLWRIDRNNRLASVFEIPQVLFVFESEWQFSQIQGAVQFLSFSCSFG